MHFHGVVRPLKMYHGLPLFLPWEEWWEKGGRASSSSQSGSSGHHWWLMAGVLPPTAAGLLLAPISCTGNSHQLLLFPSHSTSWKGNLILMRQGKGDYMEDKWEKEGERVIVKKRKQGGKRQYHGEHTQRILWSLNVSSKFRDSGWCCSA